MAFGDNWEQMAARGADSYSDEWRKSKKDRRIEELTAQVEALSAELKALREELKCAREAVRWLIDYVPPLIRAPEAGGGSAMKSDIAGCSTCPPGQERYETFWSSLRGGERMVKYDYRTADGTLFSCIGRSLGGCRLGRDLWLERRQVHQEVET